MSAKVEPKVVESWALITDGGEILPITAGSENAETALSYIGADLDSSTKASAIPIVIVPLAEWERVKRYDARTMPLGDLYDVYDERLQDSISEDE